MAKPDVIIVHGIHTNDANDAWMDYLVWKFGRAGWGARKWTYGYAYALLTKIQNPGRARALKDLVKPGDWLLGHSNGGTLIEMASKRGAPIEGAILLMPALDTHRVLGKQVRAVNLYYHPDDEWVGLAGFLPDHPWGPQGRDGLSVKDERYMQVNVKHGEPQIGTLLEDGRIIGAHSGILAQDKLGPWSDRIIDEAQARL